MLTITNCSYLPTDVVTNAESLVPVDGPDAWVAQGKCAREPGKLEGES